MGGLRGNKARVSGVNSVEGRGLTRLKTGLGIGPWWGRRRVAARGDREAFVRVTAAAAAARGLLLAPGRVLLRVVRCPRTTGGPEGRGALGGVVGAGHDDGAGAGDAGEGRGVGAGGDVGVVGGGGDDDGGMARGGVVIDADGAGGGRAERRGGC